jgi:prolipoprotein diacylglyceryltransferase
VGLVLLVVLYRRRRFGGEAMCAYAASYAVFRFCTEIFRADVDRGVWWGGISTSQLVALASLPLCLFLWRRGLQAARAGRSRNPHAPLAEETLS